MEKLVANLSSKVQKKTLQGRNYLVAPVAMILEGVFAGSEGPILYESAEIVKSVAAWNGRPITLGHPELPNGQKVSGCTAEALDTMGIGMILNTRFNKKTKKLVAEAWIEEDRLKALPAGYEISTALATDTQLEVSTGLFVDAIVTNGNYNGKEYTKKAVNFAPDHLAILLDTEGACSIKDGAGLLVNKAQKRIKRRKGVLTANAGKSYSELVEAVEKAVEDKYMKTPTEMGESPEIEVEDVFADYVIIEKDDRYYKQNFADKDGSVTLLGDLIEVTRKVTYQPLVANKKATMTREELTAALGDDHKDFVANLSEDQVAAIAKLKAVAPVVEQPKAEPAPVANSLDEVVAAAPAALQGQLKDALVANQRLRAGYVTAIIANKANTFEAVELEAMSTVSLEKLASLAVANTVQPETESRTPIYAGSPVANSKPVTEQGFGIPSTL